MRSNRMLLVGAAALALLIVGALVVYQSRDDGTGRQPVEVAASFLEAYGAFDAEQAITYQADDADLRASTRRSEIATELRCSESVIRQPLSPQLKESGLDRQRL